MLIFRGCYIIIFLSNNFKVMLMKELLLTDIIKNTGAKCDYTGDLKINGVSSDTRTIKKGNLFIALVGEKFNGHDYVKVAEENGAAAVLCSQEVETSLPVLMVDDTLRGLQRVAAYYRRVLDIKVVGITGSNGKTTTRDMIKTVLSTKYNVFSTAKNLNNEIGLPGTILQLDESCEIAVLEMGMNHLGEISRLTAVANPDVAVITNVGKAHIGNLGSQENILKAKLEIIEGLKEDGLLILNGDDKLLAGADTGSVKKEFISVDCDNGALRAFDIKSIDGKTEFSVEYQGKTYSGYIPVLGKYNVLNALEAMMCGLHFKIDIETAFEALSSFQSVSMRCESEEIGGIVFVKDYYNSSPDSARVALEALSSYSKSGKTVALLGQMLELGEFSEKEHMNLGKMCKQYNINFAFFIGDDYKAFEKGMPENSKSYPKENKAEMIEDIKAFSSTLSKGDAVLVKGSRGMKMEEVFEALKEYLTQK